jgi:hypothetical protein
VVLETLVVVVEVDLVAMTILVGEETSVVEVCIMQGLLKFGGLSFSRFFGFVFFFFSLH